MDLSEYFRAIMRGWWMVVLCALAGAFAASAITSTIQPTYQSTVRFLVVSPPVQGQSALQSDELSRGRIASYAALVESDKFVGRIVQGNTAGVTPWEALQAISASSDRDTLLLTVVVTMEDAAKATATGAAVAANFGAAVNELEENRGASNQPAAPQTLLKVVAGPTTADEPISPKDNLNVGLGTLAGAVLGIAAAVVRRRVNRSLQTPEQVEEATGLTLLARVPASRAAKSLRKLLDKRPDSLADEAARRLRTNIDFIPVTPQLRTLTVTSATSGEGKSTVSLLLAKTWAEAGNKVLLVEADLRHARLAVDLGLGKTTGLSNVLTGQLPDRVIQKTAQDGLYALAGGTLPLRPTELLAGPRMRSLLQELSGEFDKVIVDATALQPLSDAALLAAMTDGTVVVVRHEHVSHDVLTAALENLRAVDSQLLGVVVNALPARLCEHHRRGLPRIRRTRRADNSEEIRTTATTLWPEPPKPQRDPALPPPGRG